MRLENDEILATLTSCPCLQTFLQILQQNSQSNIDRMCWLSRT